MICRVGQLGDDDARAGCGTGDMYSGPHMVARKEAEVGGAVPNAAGVPFMETSAPTTWGTPANLHVQAKSWED